MTRQYLLGVKACQSIVAVLVLGFGFGFVNKSILSSLTTDTTTYSLQNGRSVSIQIIPEKTKHAYDNDNQQVIHHNNSTLPNFSNGGVVVFLHIPKTGGTSVRKGFQRRERITYLFSNRRSKYDTLVHKVDEWVQQPKPFPVRENKKPMLGMLEIHARNNPTLMELCQQLQIWRETARQNNVPFFAFTVLREPLSFAISYFNYYHGLPWEPRRFEYLSDTEMTEENFVRTMHFNPQCLFLTRSEQAFQRNFPEKRKNLTKDACDRAYQCLRANMDWIGTTESLNETMTLVDHVIDASSPVTTTTTSSSSSRSIANNMINHQSHHHPTLTMKNVNTGPKLFGHHNISDSSLLYLKTMTLWDQEIYENILKEYNFRSYHLTSESN